MKTKIRISGILHQKYKDIDHNKWIDMHTTNNKGKAIILEILLDNPRHYGNATAGDHIIIQGQFINQALITGYISNLRKENNK